MKNKNITKSPFWSFFWILSWPFFKKSSLLVLSKSKIFYDFSSVIFFSRNFFPTVRITQEIITSFVESKTKSIFLVQFWQIAGTSTSRTTRSPFSDSFDRISFYQNFPQWKAGSENVDPFKKMLKMVEYQMICFAKLKFDFGDFLVDDFQSKKSSLAHQRCRNQSHKMATI